MPLGEAIPLERGQQRGVAYPIRNRCFTATSLCLARKLSEVQCYGVVNYLRHHTHCVCHRVTVSEDNELIADSYSILGSAAFD